MARCQTFVFNVNPLLDNYTIHFKISVCAKTFETYVVQKPTFGEIFGVKDEKKCCSFVIRQKEVGVLK